MCVCVYVYACMLTCFWLCVDACFCKYFCAFSTSTRPHHCWLFRSVLQCVAVCCSVMQCDAVCCSVLQCATVCCSVLQYVAVCVCVSVPRTCEPSTTLTLNPNLNPQPSTQNPNPQSWNPSSQHRKPNPKPHVNAHLIKRSPISMVIRYSQMEYSI